MVNVGVFNHKGYEISYFISDGSILGYSASAKMMPPNVQGLEYIPLIVPEQGYIKSTEMALCKNFIEEHLTRLLRSKNHDG